jgi:hypothetical protein
MFTNALCKNQEQNTISVLPLNNLHKALVNIIRVRQSRKQQSIYIPRASYIDAESCLNLIISFPLPIQSSFFSYLYKNYKTLNLFSFGNVSQIELKCRALKLF